MRLYGHPEMHHGKHGKIASVLKGIGDIGMTSEELARKLRIHVVEMAHCSKESHVASALSICDLIAVLYNEILVKFPADPKCDSRDRFVLSKGHACSAVYAALAETGFFNVEELNSQCQDGSRLSGHITKDVPGVELSTGSLGHGCCVAAGMALNAKVKGKKNKVYSLIGDGECDEGSVWEMALFAHQYKLNNYIVIVDHNKMQAMGFCDEVADHVNLADKWRTFGWDVLEIDGHDHNQIRETLKCPGREKPICVIAHTIKGKGVSFMENNLLWHYRDPQGEDFEKAMQELERN